MRRSIRRHAGPLATLVAVVALTHCSSGPQPPSLVVITLDTLRADHLGCYGYPRSTSPHLDALAAESTRFERALAPMSTTLPVHVSLFTGTNPGRHGIRANIAHMDHEVRRAAGLRMLAEMLASAGYDTAAFVSAAPLKRETGIDAGFAHFDEPPGIERRAAATTDLVLDWLRHRRGGPTLLWVHYFDPHSPYTPPPPWDRRFTDDDETILPGLARQGVEGPTPLLLDLIDHYDGEVAYLDDQLGRLFAALHEAGLWDDAAVVVLGDHGEGLGEHGWLDHGRIYDEQLHVPLLYKPPGGAPPAERSHAGLVSLIDVLPTLASSLGLPITVADRAQFEGIDLLVGGQRRDWVYSERVDRHRDWEPGRRYALTGPRYKYLLSTESPDALYDLQADPAESVDLREREPETAAHLQELLAAIVARYEREPGARAPEGVSPELLEELRSLGYVD